MSAAFHGINPIFIGESSLKLLTTKTDHDKHNEWKIIEITNNLKLTNFVN
jgi:hypothetical protein